MNEQPKVAILLSTYNGDKYIAEQLDSVLQQTYSNFVIVIRDDCSTDDTSNLIASYQSKHPERFHLIANDGKNLGASGSFSCLIEYVLEHKTQLDLPQAYMMFCDQDDVWSTHKVAEQVEAMLEKERHNNSLAILVHSDLEVVAEDLSPIAPSLIEFQGLEIDRNKFPHLVTSNLVTGCTAFINEALARKAIPVPKQAIMHDWWLALVATAFGSLVFMDSKLVRYRQHSKNTIGAKQHVAYSRVDPRRWKRMFSTAHHLHLLQVAGQAQEFHKRFKSQLPPRHRAVLWISACMKLRIGIVQSVLLRVLRRF